jgi:3-methyladenine DNA glycosylase AlkD
VKIDEMVAGYVQLRERKARLKADCDAATAPVQKLMDEIEALILKHFQENGMDSAKTPFGTAYTTLRTSATVADREAFRTFVEGRNAWDLVDMRANKTAVEQFREANKEIPPGLNWREERCVNIRK